MPTYREPTLEEINRWNASEFRRLYENVVNGCRWIGGKEDAVLTASILRALANEFDPENTSDPRGETFLALVKKGVSYDPMR